MKQFCLILLPLIIHHASIAQVPDSARPEVYIFPIKKVTLHLMNDSTVKGAITEITDSTL